MQNTLRVRRAEKGGVSQWDTARAVGLSFNRYWRIEKGQTPPTPEEMTALAGYFGCSVGRLFPGRSRRPAGEVA